MRPLEDIRILAVEQYGAGPWGSLHLADLGADVIKVEDPGTGGDVGRYVPPFQEGEDSLFFETFNRNKRSISLDLRNPAGRRIFEDLVRQADVVYSNLRGDVPDRLGIRYDQLRHLNPSIVCISLSGFGMTGPRRNQPGYDYVVQGLAGWMSLTGGPDSPPTKSGLSVVDYSGGLVAALTILAAVHAARRDGIGADADVSLHDVAMSMLSYEATWYLNRDHVPTRLDRSAHPSLVPFQLFQGADKRWFVVACAKEKFWQLLVIAIGEPQLSADPRFVDFAARLANREELVSLLDVTFARQPAAVWIDRLETVGVPVAGVNTLPEALVEPQTHARDLVVETDHQRFGRIRSMRTASRIGHDGDARRAPQRGEHTKEILTQFGYDDWTIRTAAENGAFG